jgi:hypothetical protein
MGLVPLLDHCVMRRVVRIEPGRCGGGEFPEAHVDLGEHLVTGR